MYLSKDVILQNNFIKTNPQVMVETKKMMLKKDLIFFTKEIDKIERDE